jgi:hypothetical protein
MAVITITTGAGGATVNLITFGRHPVKLKRDTAQNRIIASGAGEEVEIRTTDTITINGDPFVPADVDELEETLRDTVFFLAGSAAGSNLDIEIIEAIQMAGSEIRDQPIGSHVLEINSSSGHTFADGQLVVMPVRVRKGGSRRGVAFFQGTQGNFTGDQYNGVGLYSYDDTNGLCTKITETADNQAIWKGTAFTIQKAAFPAPVTVDSDKIYVIIAVCNLSAQVTLPAIGVTPALGNTALATIDFTNSFKISGTVAGTNNTLPATINMSAVTRQSGRPWFALYE